MAIGIINTGLSETLKLKFGRHAQSNHHAAIIKIISCSLSQEMF